MADYRWNEKKDYKFWNHFAETEEYRTLSDKQLVANPNLARFEIVIGALCKVVAELVEKAECENESVLVEQVEKLKKELGLR